MANPVHEGANRVRSLQRTPRHGTGVGLIASGVWSRSTGWNALDSIRYVHHQNEEALLIPLADRARSSSREGAAGLGVDL
jgi:hypothetical protein